MTMTTTTKTNQAELCFTLSILFADGELTDEAILTEAKEYGITDPDVLNQLADLAESEEWIEEDGGTVEETYAKITA